MSRLETDRQKIYSSETNSCILSNVVDMNAMNHLSREFSFINVCQPHTFHVRGERISLDMKSLQEGRNYQKEMAYNFLNIEYLL